MSLTPAGLALLRDCEGCESRVYYDVANLPTIGVGHLLTRDERSSGKLRIGDVWVRYAAGLRDDQIDTLLQQDVAAVAARLDLLVEVPLRPAQRDALISFAFNVGLVAFGRSTLLKRLNAGAYEAVPGQMGRWIYAAGKIIPGLERRRRREAAHWRGET